MHERLRKIIDPYQDVLGSLCIYWRAYGGIKALALSPYLHTSAVISFIVFGLLDAKTAEKLPQMIISIIPSMLGFTLGGYAVLIAFGDDEFRRLLAGNSKENTISPFMMVNATFIHFIILQAISLFVALLQVLIPDSCALVSVVSFWIFCYAILTAVAAAFAILRLAKSFDDFISIQKKTRGQDDSPQDISYPSLLHMSSRIKRLRK